MGKTTLTWQFGGDNPDSFEVYRGDNPMDKNSLPAPLADNLAGSDRSYEDATVVEDETYFYRVAARVGGAIAVSDELEHTATPSSWTPLDLSPQLWLDASDNATITVDGSDGVSAWEDKSGNGHDVSQATAGSRPILKAAEQNGLDVIRFDGSNDALVFDTLWSQTTEQNIFLVGNTTFMGVGYRAFINRTPDNVNTAGLFFGTGIVGANQKPAIYWAGAVRCIQLSAVTRAAIFRWGFKLAGASSSALTQIDGGSPVSASFTASTLADWLLIGGAGGQEAAFDAYEIIITGPLDVSEIDQVTGYLAWKWGLEGNLPSGHPYENGPP